jgi:outer membrane protein TolC
MPEYGYSRPSRYRPFIAPLMIALVTSVALAESGRLKVTRRAHEIAQSRLAAQRQMRDIEVPDEVPSQIVAPAEPGTAELMGRIVEQVPDPRVLADAIRAELDEPAAKVPGMLRDLANVIEKVAPVLATMSGPDVVPNNRDRLVAQLRPMAQQFRSLADQRQRWRSALEPALDELQDIARQLAVMLGDILENGPVVDALEELNKTRRELSSLVREYTVPVRYLRRLESIERPKKLEIKLDEVVRRTLANNYLIQVSRYGPAIDATRIVEAEANFDAVFFANLSWQKQDRPSPSQLAGTQSENTRFEAGIRKLLSTGTQIQTSYNLSRSETNLQFQTLNPSWFNQFVVEFRQPFLRGFGLDFNRSQIELRRLDHSISIETLRRDIQDQVFNAEQAYWRLYQARRAVAVSATLLTELETILYSLRQRKEIGYDVYEVQLKQTESLIEQREVEFIELRNNVKNAEDTLKALVNDPDVTLAHDLEIIPTTTPFVEPLVFDALGEITAGLTHRSELREAKLSIEQAQIAIGVAKNQALPKLDVLFRYIVDGLGVNADRAFSQLTENDFHEYEVLIELEYPIGNRGPEAALRRARYQQAQAIAAHAAQIEQVVLEIRQAIRAIQTSYDQIGPSLRAAQASKAQLEATVKRQERRDPANLQVELNAHEALAGSRQALLDTLSNYNISLIDLERKKGTLLRYNNIVIEGVNDEDYLSNP